MKKYEIAVDGWILGAARSAGDIVGPLSDAQAEYPLLYGHIKEIEEPAETDADTPAQRGRRAAD